MVKFNGENFNIAGKTLAEYLADEDYDLRRIVVECNEKIVSQAEYGGIVLRDCDCVEVVSFVGGG